jgi:hypothetical protein
VLVPRLYFRRQESGRLIAKVQDEDLARIPATDDSVYAPSAEEAGAYLHLRVVGREFYYDQQGALALVSLECVELPSQPDALPPLLADPQTA